MRLEGVCASEAGQFDGVFRGNRWNSSVLFLNGIEAVPVFSVLLRCSLFPVGL